jgi:hypothetical protein
MALSPALPGDGEAALAARAIHDRVGRFNRTTVRHALRELVRHGRAEFTGIDRHRRYRRFVPGMTLGQPLSAPRRKARPTAKVAWRGYGARGEGVAGAGGETAAEAARLGRARPLGAHAAQPGAGGPRARPDQAHGGDRGQAASLPDRAARRQRDPDARARARRGRDPHDL